MLDLSKLKTNADNKLLQNCENSSKIHAADLFETKGDKGVEIILNPLPNDKIFDWSKLKAFADDSINVNKKFQFILERIENIVGKGENAGYQHFLLYPQCFQKAAFSGSLKVGIVW